MVSPSKQGAAPTKRPHSASTASDTSKQQKHRKGPPLASKHPNPSNLPLMTNEQHKGPLVFIPPPPHPRGPPPSHPSSLALPPVVTDQKLKVVQLSPLPPHHRSVDHFGFGHYFYPVPPMMYQHSSAFSELSLPIPNIHHSRSFGSSHTHPPPPYGVPFQPKLQYMSSHGAPGPSRSSLLDTPMSDVYNHLQIPVSVVMSSDPKTHSAHKKDRDVAVSALLDLPTKVTSRPPLVEQSNAKKPPPSSSDDPPVKKTPLLPSAVYKRARNPLVAERAMRLLEQAIPTNIACKCKNTACLKLYCSCFQTGALCDAELCICSGCNNTEEFTTAKGTRTRAVFEILNRRVDAFEPRLRKKTGVGCACQKTKCLRKYCDCFAIGNECSDRCKCEACENRPLPKSAAVAQKKAVSQSIST